MAEYPNSGILFKNDRKEKETHADYRGEIDISGVKYWLNGWIKAGKKGNFISLSIKPKEQKPQQPDETPW